MSILKLIYNFVFSLIFLPFLIATFVINLTSKALFLVIIVICSLIGLLNKQEWNKAMDIMTSVMFETKEIIDMRKKLKKWQEELRLEKYELTPANKKAFKKIHLYKALNNQDVIKEREFAKNMK